MPCRKNISVCVLVLLGVVVADAAFARISNKWRLQVSESAKSSGVIVLRFAPVGEDAFDVEIAVAKGTGENAVARRIRDELRRQLPEDRYHVETDDGEDVLIKKRSSGVKFDLKVISNTVKSVRLNLDRE